MDIEYIAMFSLLVVAVSAAIAIKLHDNKYKK